MHPSETQINQIYLVDPKNPKASQILYEEALSDSAYLFLIGELTNLTKRTEKEELKKISDIILTNFKSLKKPGSEELFESALSRINQDLADLAVKGKKSWLGKFSGLIALISGNSIFLANTGAAAAYMKRKSEIVEILPSEKPGLHPLKTFTNFTAGKLKLNDQVIIASSNVFNFIAVRRLGEILSEKDQDSAVSEILSILGESVNEQNSFCGFIFTFGENLPSQKPAAAAEPVYAPEPEEIEYAPATPDSKWSSWKMPTLPSLGKVPTLPRFNLPSLPLPKIEWFSRLSMARKFFFVSFVIFLLILAINVGVFLFRQNTKKTEAKINETAELLVTKMNDAESAFIYQNDESAFKILAEANTAFEELKRLDSKRAQELEPVLAELSNKINRKAVVENPAVFMDLKANPTNIARAGSNFLFSNPSPNSIFTLSQGELKNVFLLNKPDSDISGIAHLSGFGNVVSGKSRIYRINETQKQFDAIQTVSDSDLFRLKVLPNRLYTIDKSGKQVLRFNLSQGQLQAPQSATRSPIETENIQDLALDTDIYLLYSNRVQKYSNGNLVNFELVDLTEPLTDARRMNVGASIYVLEPAKKRLIFYNKNGSLLNQIYFPNAADLTDFYVDEASRSIYLIDSNKLLKITF